MANETRWGIFAIMSAAVLISAAITLTQEEIDNGYVCTSNDNFGVFESLSSTGKTGYYTDEGNVSRRKVCRNGYWEPLAEYLNRTGKTLEYLQAYNDTEENLSIAFNQNCTDVLVNVSKLVEVQINQTITPSCDTGSNGSCASNTPFVESTLVNQSHVVEELQQSCVKTLTVENATYNLVRENVACNHNETWVCCWDVQNGGSNVGNRDPKWKFEIRPGEVGQCSDLIYDEFALTFTPVGVPQ